MWRTDPVDNTATNRPAIIWVHAGGFNSGIGSAYAAVDRHCQRLLATRIVSLSIEYRIDTTSNCQGVQDYTGDPNDPAYLAHARMHPRHHPAQQDTQAAVRWVRRHAADYRVDPNKVAVGGFSAGAVTAANVAYNSDLAGSWAYSSDDDPHADSHVQAAFGASGCNYPPTTIGAGDGQCRSFTQSSTLRSTTTIAWCQPSRGPQRRTGGGAHVLLRPERPCTEPLQLAQGRHRCAMDHVPGPRAEDLQRHAAAERRPVLSLVGADRDDGGPERHELLRERGRTRR